MNLTLYTVTDEKNKIGKTKSSAISLTGNLRSNCSMIDPIMIVAASSITSNYAYITQFSRYYFINNIISIRTGLFQLEMHVDVLESFSTQIKALSAVIKRQQNVYNLYLDDPLFQSQNKRQISTKIIGSGFNEDLSSEACFVLTVARG